ncbi:catalase [Sphaerisporangium krabiense]|uniref:Catalase n=1 Tax=Sphaerisporangium krabiense TaxID=763782 RepID=A0A7W9DR11_9ACTN|nr:catalase [Sphaerisporangium krabiense]MBB5628056.1 catalase [Sphaerisporangium krabiense]GII62221.1 catalase [Sphaerisporangium krabiense]
MTKTGRPTSHGDGHLTMTDRQGHPIYDNTNLRTVGDRGPATLENYSYLERVGHFTRERIPERVVHARGFTAFGHFESYGTWGEEPISRYTRAKLFQERGKRTEVAVRLSLVIGGRESEETARDVRGFAVKFYTEDGNWDLVGNNLAVFFIRDPAKFVDVVHAFKPDPVTFHQDPNRAFDLLSLTPESMHLLVNLFSPRGLPSDLRHMQGFGVNTYKWVNDQGDTFLVKYHWIPKLGVRSMTAQDAARIQATELSHASKDLQAAIENGEFPEWEMRVQVMSDDEHPELDFDPLDATKAWPEEIFPPKPVGRLVLDQNAQDYFTESEQIAFGAGVIVDGLELSEDKMLTGRTFAYGDTQRYRIGPNYQQVPVNRPKNQIHTNQRDSQALLRQDPGGPNPHVNYSPSVLGGLTPAPPPPHDTRGPEYHGRLTGTPITRTNDYKQAGQRFRLMEQWERDDLVNNLTVALSACDRPIRERMIWHLLMVEDELGLRVGEGIGVSVADVSTLEPLPGQVLTEEDRVRLANLGDNGPRDVAGLRMTHCVPNERAEVPG